MRDKPAVVMAGSGFTQTFAELDAAANRLSRVLRSAGLQPGDHVALCMENHDRYLEVLWGCRYAGLIYTAASSRLTSGELAYILDDCGAKAFITSLYLADQAAEIIADTPGVRLRLMLDGTIDGYDSYEDVTAAQSSEPLADRIAGTDMLYSSGTTGRPKGVLQPFEQRPLETSAMAVAELLKALYGADERVRLPVAGAALPRRAAALLHGDAHDRQHGRRDGALRRRSSTCSSSRRTASRTARSCRRCSSG